MAIAIISIRRVGTPMVVARLMYPASVPRIHLVSAGYSDKGAGRRPIIVLATRLSRRFLETYESIAETVDVQCTILSNVFVRQNRIEHVERTFFSRILFGQCLESWKVGKFTDARVAIPSSATFVPPPLRNEISRGGWRGIDRVTMGSDDIKLRNDRSFACHFLSSQIFYFDSP